MTNEQLVWIKLSESGLCGKMFMIKTGEAMVSSFEITMILTYSDSHSYRDRANSSQGSPSSDQDGL